MDMLPCLLQVPTGTSIPDLESRTSLAREKLQACCRVLLCSQAMSRADKLPANKDYARAVFQLASLRPSSSSVNKARKRLALLLHPDKAIAELQALKPAFEAALARRSC